MENPPPVAMADLRRVARAVERLDSAREEFVAAVMAARASGETLRDIAQFAGVSHQRIAQIERVHRARENDKQR